MRRISANDVKLAAVVTEEDGDGAMAASSTSSSLTRPDPEAAFLRYFTHPFISLPAPVNADRLFAAQAQDVLERQIAYLPGESPVCVHAWRATLRPLLLGAGDAAAVDIHAWVLLVCMSLCLFMCLANCVPVVQKVEDTKCSIKCVRSVVRVMARRLGFHLCVYVCAHKHTAHHTTPHHTTPHHTAHHTYTVQSKYLLLNLAVRTNPQRGSRLQLSCMVSLACSAGPAEN